MFPARRGRLRARMRAATMLLVAAGVLLLACNKTAAPQGGGVEPQPGAHVGAAEPEAVAPSPFRVALVSSLEGLSDNGLNAMAWAGLLQLQQETGVRPLAMEPKTMEDLTAHLTTLATTAPHDLIWAVGPGMAAAVADVAAQFPDQPFAIVDAVVPNLPNVTSVTFREQEGAFLMGVLAAQATRSGAVGFVGTVPGSTSDTYEAGFRAGIAHENADVRLEVAHAGTWDDANVGLRSGLELVDRGVDVLFHPGGVTGRGVIAAAKESGIWALGADVDQHELAAETVISSLHKRVDVAVRLVTARAMAGEFPGGKHIRLGLADGAVDWPESTRFPDEAVRSQLESVRQAIVAGDIVVPDQLD